MTKAWKQFEGHLINEEFHLRQYVGGSSDKAVFLSGHGERRLETAAIKLIRANRRNAELQLSRWRLAANLSHPHLIQIFQAGRCQLGNIDLLYVVMEYAEEDLSLVLRDRPLTPAEARDMLAPALEALAYVHEKGFVHGHIKPANIMAIDDQLKISTDGVSPMGESIGNLWKPDLYDAPEIAGGVSITAAGDVWSLGMTLAETLTQQLPVWELTNQEDPALPETLPEPFLDIARHCLRRDPQRRWTVAQIAARLLLPVSQDRVGARSPKTPARWRYTVASAVIAFALVAILAGLKLNRRPGAERTAGVAVEERSLKQTRPQQRQATEGGGPDTARRSVTGDDHTGAARSDTPLQDAEGATTPAVGVAQGQVIQQVLPDVPQSARDTIQGTVRVSVRVHVDPTGGAVGAQLDSPGPSKYFAGLALRAAERWKFRPMKIDGQDRSSEWILRFGFSRTDTTVHPVRVSP
jgi:TonB family protein